MPAAQTIKQAKAAYKKRQGGNISDTERRRIEREIQLHDRAQSIKDRDRARAAATRRREAEQQRLKTAQALVATQRKRDIFGHKSSQFHLGAFFTKASALPMPITEPVMLCDEDNEFGQLDLNDEDLSALDVSYDDSFDTDESVFEALQDVAASEPVVVPCPGEGELDPPLDMDDFGDCFDSSTQIERELADNEPRHSLSLDSMYSFGLTTQDMEELDPPAKTKTGHTLVPPPPLLTHKPAPPAEITMTQLESFVDEDIHLSQL